MNEFISLTDLGKVFGTTSHKVGKWLKDMRLRTWDNQPSAVAFQHSLVKQMPTGRGSGYFYVWHTERTIALLEEAGHQRLSPAISEIPTFTAESEQSSSASSPAG